MTVTTGGYGDFYSKDVEVRLIAIVVMLFGIGFLSVLTATVASQFIQTDTANLSGILDADRDAAGAWLAGPPPSVNSLCGSSHDGCNGCTWRSLGFAAVRSPDPEPLQTGGSSERARTGANIRRPCHAEGRGFESLHPL